MNVPEQQQIDHWLKVAREGIDRKRKLVKEGFHRKEDLPVQGAYVSQAANYADLARTKFLNGDPISSVRREFANAARCIIKSFTMAYDVKDPDYVGDKPKPEGALDPGYGQVSWADVNEIAAIEGFNYALMAADFDLGRELAQWYQDRKDGRKMDPEVNRYAHALKYALLGERDEGSALLKKTIDALTPKPPKERYKLNYLTLSLTLSGILTDDETLFNQGLEQVLVFHEKVMIPSEDLWDTAKEFICDHAVALANLAISYHLNVTVEHDLLPEGLLVQPMDG